MLQEFGRRLNALAKDFNIALVIINNMVSCNNSASSGIFLKYSRPIRVVNGLDIQECSAMAKVLREFL